LRRRRKEDGARQKTTAGRVAGRVPSGTVPTGCRLATLNRDQARAALPRDRQRRRDRFLPWRAQTPPRSLAQDGQRAWTCHRCRRQGAQGRQEDPQRPHHSDGRHCPTTQLSFACVHSQGRQKFQATGSKVCQRIGMAFPLRSRKGSSAHPLADLYTGRQTDETVLSVRALEFDLRRHQCAIRFRDRLLDALL
jgi:hypothetical protein